MRERNLNLLSGLLFGYWYFIALPLFLSLATQGIPPVDLLLPPFVLANEPEVVIYVSMSFVCLLIASFISKKPDSTGRPADELVVVIIVAAYFVAATFLFFASEKWEGGHWHKSTGALFGASTTAIAIGAIFNAARIVAPFALLYAFRCGSIRFLTFFVLGLSISVFDLVTSGNRIVGLLFFISVLFSRRWGWRFYVGLGVFLIPVAFLNYVVPVFRGTMWSEGFDPAEIGKFLIAAVSYRIEETADIAEYLFSLFEGANIIVLSHVMGEYGVNQEFLYGSTVIGRSVMFFVPSTLFPDKPIGLGSMLGQEVQGIEGLTLNATIIGEAFANFGYWGGICLACLAYFLQRLSYLLRFFRSELGNACMFAIGIAAWRFDFAYIVIASFSLLVLVILSACLRRFVEIVEVAMNKRNQSLVV